MTKEELIKRLETTCFGLDPIDPLRLLVDDVIEALAQTERTWVGLTDEEINALRLATGYAAGLERFTVIARIIEAKIKEKNT